MNAALSQIHPIRIKLRLGILCVILTATLIRVFTEQIVVLPRQIFNLADLMLVLALFGYLFLGAIMTGGRIRMGGLKFLFALYIFILTLSTLINWPTLNTKAAVTYWLINLQGILFYFVLLNSDVNSPRGHRFIFNVIYVIGFVQPVWVVVTGQVFEVQSNVDIVTGTFGINPNQLCFAAVWMLAIIIMKRRDLPRVRFYLFLFVFVVLYLLPSWRTVWPVLPIVFFITYSFLMKRNLLVLFFKVLIVTALSVFVVFWTALFALDYLGKDSGFVRQFSGYQNLVNQVRSGQVVVSKFGKVQSYTNLPKVFSEKFHIFFVGYGPGTYNSRAYHTFALSEVKGGDPTKDAFHNMVAKEGAYRTELANKYIHPIMNNLQSVSGTVGSTFGSYVSNLVEIGAIGFCAWLGFYFMMLYQCRRVYLFSSDPFYRMVAYAATALCVFTAMVSVLDDWFAVGRIMVILWALFAIVSSHHWQMRRAPVDGETL